jgi:hypothetical protein
MGYTGEAKWCPEASCRGDAKQPRRRAGRKAGAHRRGEEPRQESFPRSAGRECTAFTSASRGNSLPGGLRFRILESTTNRRAIV